MRDEREATSRGRRVLVAIAVKAGATATQKLSGGVVVKEEERRMVDAET